MIHVFIVNIQILYTHKFSLTDQSKPRPLNMRNLNHIQPPITFEAIANDSKALGFDMPSEIEVCALLRTLVATKPAGRCLELGTGTGLATSWLADGLGPSGHLTTIDNESKWLNIAQKHLSTDPRIDILCIDGDEFLRAANKRQDQYDLIFADTWSGKYRMLDEALNLLAPGGLYVIDDMLPQTNWPDGHADKVESLMEALSCQANLHVCSLPWSCGVVLATKYLSN